MNNVGAFWKSTIPYASLVLVVLLVAVIALSQFVRTFRGLDRARYRSEMVVCLAFVFCFFVCVLALGFQFTRISNLSKVLYEMNAPYYEGGQRADPVASQEELQALDTLANSAGRSAVFAFILLVGCWLRFRKLMRYDSPTSADRLTDLSIRQ
ncbi:MAG: hypothetical protein IT366_12000 [Candidatus Hydrogenedentes bacterium]|nr:hypothetical protein [Candidatus Hydrogenedentota bacterium]